MGDKRAIFFNHHISAISYKFHVVHWLIDVHRAREMTSSTSFYLIFPIIFNCLFRLHRDDDLKAHIEFLASQGIAGVSHHSLLFSKEAPAQDVQGEEEVRR